MRKSTFLAVVLSLCLILPISVQALPSLGVIPYETLMSPPDPFEGPFGWSPGVSGFSDDLVVWYLDESGPPADQTVPIYIGTTDAGPHSFAGETLTEYATHPPDPPNSIPSFWHTFGDNYNASLGTVAVPIGSGSWVEAEAFGLDDTHPLRAGGGEAFLYQGTWTSGLPSGEWVYAMADLGGDGVFDNGKDDFSPPTMSTVPEPATVLLLGSGLLGLALLGRRLRHRKD